MSVVEEKSSRVMEVILNAATPFELLAGKVLGVGSVAFIQYAAIVVAAASLSVPGCDRVHRPRRGWRGDLPEGLTHRPAPGVRGVWRARLPAVFVLYAAAGSLVSRQEDVTGAVMPMTLLSAAGYMIAVYASTGLLDIRAGWVVLLSLIPFLAPFMMPSRIVGRCGAAVGGRCCRSPSWWRSPVRRALDRRPDLRGGRPPLRTAAEGAGGVAVDAIPQLTRQPVASRGGALAAAHGQRAARA